MQEVFKNYGKIFIYPSGEDGDSCATLLQYFNEYGWENSFLCLDDRNPRTCLSANAGKISKNGSLWLAHQDKKLYLKLKENTAQFSGLRVFNAFLELQKSTLKMLEKLNLIESSQKPHLRDDLGEEKLLEILNLNHKTINLIAYFIQHYAISFDDGLGDNLSNNSKAQNPLLCVISEIRDIIDKYYKEKFGIDKNSILVPVGAVKQKHLGNIIEILAERVLGVNSVNSADSIESENQKATNQSGGDEFSKKKLFLIAYDEERFSGAKAMYADILARGAELILAPFLVSRMGAFLNCFGAMITTFMPLKCPITSSSLRLYVCHAYIDPIAALAQRKRLLDDFWFSKKFGVNGVRVVPSLANYEIWREKFDECGFSHELFCGGYPSLDLDILEFETKLNQVRIENERERERAARRDLDNFCQTDNFCHSEYITCHSERSEESILIESVRDSSLRATHSALNDKKMATHSAQNDEMGASHSAENDKKTTLLCFSQVKNFAENDKTSASREVSAKISTSHFIQNNENKENTFNIKIDSIKKDSIESKLQNRPFVIIATTYLENISLVREFLDNRGDLCVVFRPHPGFRNNPQILALKNDYENEDGFFYDDSLKLSLDLKIRAITLLADYSSLAWTFPLTAKKPVILVSKDPEFFNNDYHKIKFHHPLLHFCASSLEQIQCAMAEISQKHKRIEQEIEKFREQEVFNLGHSSEAIVDFLFEKMKI